MPKKGVFDMPVLFSQHSSHCVAPGQGHQRGNQFVGSIPKYQHNKDKGQRKVDSSQIRLIGALHCLESFFFVGDVVEKHKACGRNDCHPAALKEEYRSNRPHSHGNVYKLAGKLRAKPKNLSQAFRYSQRSENIDK